MDWRKALPHRPDNERLDLYIYDTVERVPTIDCSLGTNPMGPPALLLEGLPDYLAPHLGQYPVDSSDFSRAIADFWKGLVQPEEILPGAGTMDILFNLLRLFAHPGTVCLGLAPQFPDVPQRFRLSGATFRVTRLSRPDYLLSLEHLLRDLTDDVSVVYLDQPHNPTGQAWTLDELQRIISRCEETGSLCVIDEAYGASLPEEHSAIQVHSPNGVVLRSFSKIWGLAGLRAGYAVSRCPEFREVYRDAALPVSLSGLSQKLVTLAIGQGCHLPKTRKRFREIKERVLRCVRDTPAVSVAETHPSTPIFYVEPTQPGENLYPRLLGAGILTERGNCYEGVTSGGVRIRIPGPEEMEIFLKLWKQAFGKP